MKEDFIKENYFDFGCARMAKLRSLISQGFFMAAQLSWIDEWTKTLAVKTTILVVILVDQLYLLAS